MKQQLEIKRYRTAYAIICVPFLCLQPLISHLMELFGLGEGHILLFQVASSVFFNGLSILFTKDFHIAIHCFSARPRLKGFIRFSLYQALNLVVGFYWLSLKILFGIGKYPEAASIVDSISEELAQEFHSSPIEVKAGIHITFFAIGLAFITYAIGLCNNVEARFFGEIVILLASSSNLLVLFSAIKNFFLTKDDSDSQE